MEHIALAQSDPELYAIIEREVNRQNYKLELIASENFVSHAVMEAAGSQLTNKYAEGYPGKRYYGGCEFVDQAEDLARERAKKIFGCEHVNVQPHSGSQANMAVYMTALQPGDKVMGLDLSHGGHLTHGHPMNFSGQLYNFVGYQVEAETEVINYDHLLEQAKQVKPKMIVAGASAYPRTLDFAKFRQVADACGALLFVDCAHIAGLIAAGLHPSPIPYADFVTTTTHKTLRGPRGGMAMCKTEYAEKLDKTVMPGIQGGPLMHIIAAKAVAFNEALTPEFKEYQKRIVANARSMADEFLHLGQRLVSGGTDTHLLLINLMDKNVSGKKIENALDLAAITVNKNTVPFDTRKPFVTSGIRIGTPTLTTRGMGAEEMRQIAGMINRVIEDHENEALLAQIAGEVSDLCERFPLYDLQRIAMTVET